MFYVYILKSRSDGSFYVGQTNDLQRRLENHNAGLSKYTSRKKPWCIVYFEEYESRKEAIVRTIS